MPLLYNHQSQSLHFSWLWWWGEYLNIIVKYEFGVWWNVYIFSFWGSPSFECSTEKVNLFKIEGQTKVGGTLVCVSGAIVMALFRGPALFGGKDEDFTVKSLIIDRNQPVPHGWLVSSFLGLGFDLWHIGVFCLIGNCMCMAAFLAVQAPVLKKYPAYLSVAAYSYFFGASIMITTAIFFVREPKDWSLTQSEVLAVIFAVCFRDQYHVYLDVLILKI